MKKQLLMVGICSVVLAACGTMTPSTYPAASPSDDMSDGNILDSTMMDQTYQLTAQNGSGQSGTLTLSPMNNNTEVEAVLALTGGNFTGPQPAHIHEGSCPNPGAVKFPLNNVVNGASTTILDVTLEELLATAPQLAVNVHKSAAESSVYTSCGDLN